MEPGLCEQLDEAGGVDVVDIARQLVSHAPVSLERHGGISDSFDNTARELLACDRATKGGYRAAHQWLKGGGGAAHQQSVGAMDVPFLPPAVCRVPIIGSGDSSC